MIHHMFKSILLTSVCISHGAERVIMPIVDTGQTATYTCTDEMAYPQPHMPFYGQDAQYCANPPAYRDNNNGTVSDRVTGLMWTKAVNSDKMTLEEAEAAAKKMTVAGYTDWRVPNIKELYSLIDFRGYTGWSGAMTEVPAHAIPFINTDYFDFMYGCTAAGERYIDAQWLSCTRYVSTTMDHMETLFGVNFADGRIKGYGFRKKGAPTIFKKFYVRYVRGRPYGDTAFQNTGNETITDNNTGLMWMRTDSGKGMTWEEALAYAENSRHAGYTDWRLPNAKELQYLVDYTRAPDTTHSAAIDPVFQTSVILNEEGQKDYPFFWTSTTHLDGPVAPAKAVYISFGRAIGQMHNTIMDVHGAGAQRSDPKTGRARIGQGPQGDAQRITNYVRLVRGGNVQKITTKPTPRANTYPQNVRILTPHPTQPVPFGPNKNTQERAREHENRFVAHVDKNHDGKVSRAEFDGPKDHFDRLDKNRDGYLSEEEAPRHPPPR